MRILLALCLLLPAVSFAQAPADGNIQERPDAAVCTVRFMDDNLGTGLTTCLITDPTFPAFLDISNHFECRPYGSLGPATTEHAIIVPAGDGNVKVWGVIRRMSPTTAPSISNPSEFWKECEDVPKAPVQLGGHPRLEDSVA